MRAALQPEFTLGQRRDDRARHTDGEAHQHHLDQLMRDLGFVPADAARERACGHSAGSFFVF